MARRGLWSILMVILLVAASIAVPKVESWSEPVYTKPWSESDDTEKAPGDLFGEPSDDHPDTDPEAREAESLEAKAENSSHSAIDEFLLDFENLYGTWYIWTPGTAVTNRAPASGEYLGHNYVEGADQGVIVIDEDGIYSMSHTAWAIDKTVKGTWRLSYPREINGEVLQALVLLNGITGVNWAVAPSPNGKIRLLWAMEWADGSATWIFDSELYRE